MKRLGRLLMLATCMLAVCLAMVGCSNANDQYKEPFVGSWEISGMTSDGESATGEDLSLFKAFGLYVYLDLNEDGSCLLDMYGETMEGTWEATGEGTGRITLEDKAQDMSIVDGELIMQDDADELRFAKIDPADKTSVEEGEIQDLQLDVPDEEPAEDEAA